jgi:CubicO group peptidase (beta-lactamase class C family)
LEQTPIKAFFNKIRIIFFQDTPMFGTPGAGGQMGYADPANKLGIGFASNYHSSMGLRDLRFRALEKAIYDCVDKINK